MVAETKSSSSVNELPASCTCGGRRFDIVGESEMARAIASGVTVEAVSLFGLRTTLTASAAQSGSVTLCAVDASTRALGGPHCLAVARKSSVVVLLAESRNKPGGDGRRVALRRGRSAAEAELNVSSSLSCPASLLPLHADNGEAAREGCVPVPPLPSALALP